MTKVENGFEVAAQSLVLAPKTVKVQAFIYRSINDLENLIAFIGTDPKVHSEKGKLSIMYGKWNISENSVILRNSYGQVERVMNFAEADLKYDIAAQRDFDKVKDSQIPEKKVKVLKEKK